MVITRRTLTMRPDSDVPPMSACVYVSGMDATWAKRDPCASASPAPLRAMPAQRMARLVVNAGTRRQRRNRQNPSLTRTPGGTRLPNRRTSASTSRLGRK